MKTTAKNAPATSAKKTSTDSTSELEALKKQKITLEETLAEMAQLQEESRAIQEQADYLQTAVDTGFASIEFLPDGTILSANRNFLNVLGYAEEKDVVGQHHRMFCEEEYAHSSAYKNFWNDLAAGQIQAGEFKRKTRSGGEVWISASYTPVKDLQGTVIKVINCHRHQ